MEKKMRINPQHDDLAEIIYQMMVINKANNPGIICINLYKK